VPVSHPFVPFVFVCLNSSSRLNGEVSVLHCAHVPPLRVGVELELERLVVGNLVLVGGHVDSCQKEQLASLIKMFPSSGRKTVLFWLVLSKHFVSIGKEVTADEAFLSETEFEEIF
jgi:hypothetical protein